MILSVNIDHIATLRQARKGVEPCPIAGAKEALKAGADGITFHLREDRRHIQDEDVYNLFKEIDAPLNFEGSLAEDIIKIMIDTKPYECTLVPEKREEVTTEGGLNVLAYKNRLLEVIPRLKAANILVSLFIDPVEEQIKASKEVGADAIELHTGVYSNSNNPQKEFLILKEMAAFGKVQGLQVNAGHGLNYENTKKITEISDIHELNIGHSIISHSIFNGIHDAVKTMIKIVKG